MEKGANYGLEVEVENEDNDLVDVAKYFSNADCPTLSGKHFTSKIPKYELPKCRNLPKIRNLFEYFPLK
jgi:hypothetical protein